MILGIGEKLDKCKKIGVGLLILSLLISLVTFNPIYFIINLLLLSLILIIRFKMVKYIAILLSVYSIYFFILNFYGNVWQMLFAVIQILLLNGGLYLIIYSCYAGKERGIMRKDWLFFLKFTGIIIVAVILIHFINSSVYISISR